MIANKSKPVHHLGKQIRYADRQGIPYVAILGPDEVAAGQVVVKDLSSGEQQAYTEEEAIKRLRAALQASPVQESNRD